MMKLGMAIDDVRHAETELARRLHALSERFAAEQDLYHLGGTLAGECERHIQRLGPFAKRYGTVGKPRREPVRKPVREPGQRPAGQPLGPYEEAGMLLLHDLRELYLAAQEAEIAWVILGQAAQAVYDADLFALTGECRTPSETRIKWLRTRIKQAAPQILATA